MIIFKMYEKPLCFIYFWLFWEENSSLYLFNANVSVILKFKRLIASITKSCKEVIIGINWFIKISIFLLDLNYFSICIYTIYCKLPIDQKKSSRQHPNLQ